MAIVEDEVVILLSIRFRETSRIAIALTPEHGKVHLLAKGAREARNRFGGALELLARSRIVFYLKKTRELHLMQSASVEEPYLAILAHPRDYHLGNAAVEFVERVLADEDPHPDVYAELAAFLDARNADPGGGGADGGLRGLQLRIAAHLGYAPHIDSCTRCGRPADSPAGFGVAEGGILCRRETPEGEMLPLSRATLARLRAMLAGEAEGARDEATDRQVGRIVEAFLRYHIVGYQGLRSLKSLAEWRQI